MIKLIPVTLYSNGKPALLDAETVMFAEECESENDNGKKIFFTRIYLKQPIHVDEDVLFIDIKENVKDILKAIK